MATISNFSRMFKRGNEFSVVTRDARALDCYVLIFLRCCVSFGVVQYYVPLERMKATHKTKKYIDLGKPKSGAPQYSSYFTR